MEMKTRIALMLFALMVVATPAVALNWGVGADLGYTLFMPDDKYDIENINIIGIPLNSQSGFLYEVGFPTTGGLRLSFAGEKPTHEAWLGVSMGRFSIEDIAYSTMQLSGNYQFNFDVQSAVKPYLTAGLGMYRVGYSNDDDSESAMSMYYGGGVGASFKMGTGRLRGELRYDMVGEGTIEDDYPVIPEGGALGFKLGFDLWAK
jgi:opacity protein-like surface antigen